MQPDEIYTQSEQDIFGLLPKYSLVTNSEKLGIVISHQEIALQ